MYFNKRNNPVVQALGSRCLAPAAVISYKKAMIPNTLSQYDGSQGQDDDDIDSIEMDEGLFDKLSANAPNEDVTDDMIQKVGCKTIRSKLQCINKGVTPNGANGIGIDTGRRGNDDSGECMYFNKRNNPIVQALGSRCLAPKAVVSYKQAMRPPMDDMIDDDEIDTVEINMVTLANLAPYVELYNDEIEAEMVKTCKQIKKRKACLSGVSVQYPNGVDTGRRGNDNPGECMYFNRRNNPIVQALGNQCLAPAAVKKLVQSVPPMVVNQDDDDDEDIDAVEMSQGLFDRLSANAPNEDVTDDMMKYCKEIKKEGVCLRSSSKAPIGRTTNRRGNEGDGECMWFQRKKNPVVQALGNRCLPPQSVINYKKAMRPPMVENEFFVALGLRDENNELNYNALSMVIIMMVLIGFGAYYKLFKNNKKKEGILNGERRPSQYQSV